MLAGVGGQHRWRDPIRWTFGIVLSPRSRRGAPGGGGGLWSGGGSAAPSRMGGWRPLLLKSQRDWLLARIAEKPDLTLRAVMAELAKRGTPASYGAVWRFFAREGVTFKKKPARQ